MNRSPKTRLRWRWARIRSLAGGLALGAMWFALVLSLASLAGEGTAVGSLALIILITLSSAYILGFALWLIVGAVGQILSTRRRTRRK